jgi:hypothetical protein
MPGCIHYVCRSAGAFQAIVTGTRRHVRLRLVPAIGTPVWCYPPDSAQVWKGHISTLSPASTWQRGRGSAFLAPETEEAP